MEGEGIATTKTGDLEAIPSASKLVLTQEAPVSEVPTPIPTMVHYASAQELKVVGNLFVRQNFWTD